MILPTEYVWFEPVLVASVVVFIVSWIGNNIFFGNRVANALITSVIFGAIFGTIVYFGYGSISMKVTATPEASAPGQKKQQAQ